MIIFISVHYYNAQFSKLELNFIPSCIQIFYDTTETASHLRRYVSLSLAWWHSMKHAVHQVWKFFALSLWAPMWHHLYPGSLFLIKGKSPQDEISHLLYAAHAYPAIAEDLHGLLTDRTLSQGNLAMVKDLIFLFEFAIPSVETLTPCVLFIP